MMQNDTEFTEIMPPESPTKRSSEKFRMDFERHRDDQLNTGVAALVGGFSLTNSSEMEIGGSLLDTFMYVLAIIAVHGSTCSALTSAFLYRTTSPLVLNENLLLVLWPMSINPLMNFP